MKLYLVRHGDYTMEITKEMTALDVLSEQGTKDITNLMNFLKPKNLEVASIFHSGKNRAQQTAELLAQGFVCDQAPQVYRGLQPGDDVAVIADDVSQWEEDVLVVGHLPFMGRLVSQLTTGQENHEVVNFQTGVMVCLNQIDRRRWTIEWVLSPSILE